MVAAGLSRERVLDAALGLMKREGLDALSMRRLGRELGVEAMSLYRHVKNKGDLLDGIHERVLSRMRLPARRGSWRADVRSLALAFASTLRAHPEAVLLFATRPAVAPGSLDHVERAIGSLREAGLDPSEALTAFQALFTFVVGHAVYHYASAHPERPAVVYADLPHDRYPHLVRLARHATDPEAQLELGIDAILDRVEQLASAARRSKRR